MDDFTGSSTFALGAVLYQETDTSFPPLKLHLHATSMYNIRRVAEGAIACLISMHNGDKLPHQCLEVLLEAQDWNRDGKLEVSISLDPDKLPQ